MKPKHLIFALVVVALLGACGVAKGEWVTFTSEAGNFQVSVPGTIQESVNITKTPLGPIEAHVFALHRGAFDYAVAYTDYPVPHLAEANAVGAVEGGVVRALDSLGATLVSKKDIFLDDALGIEFQGEFLGGRDFDTAGVVHGRVYLDDTRLYQLMVVAHTDQIEPADPERFLTSFQWLKPGEVGNESMK